MNLTDDEERMPDGKHGRPAGCPRQARCPRQPPGGTAVSAVFFAWTANMATLEPNLRKAWKDPDVARVPDAFSYLMANERSSECLGA